MYRDNRTGDYPLYRHEIISRRPNMSLSAGDWDDSVLKIIEVSLVVSSECPAFDPATHKCVEQYPVMINGVWTQQWKVEIL